MVTVALPVAGTSQSRSREEQQYLIEEINRLRRERNAVILAHNYQVGEIQDLADYVGDSLGLSQQAAKTNADVIVFCGVHFMAESASIMSPDKMVLIPDLEAGCSLADTITAEQLRAWKAEHPGAVVVSYVNTSAEVKAESDYTCTSGNAIKVIQAIPADKEILFLPDMFLGSFLEKVTGRKMHVWMGECHVHAGIRPEMVKAARAAFPESEFLIHPECGCTTSVMYHLAHKDIPEEGTHLLSTEGMMRYAKDSSCSSFVVGTEVGVLHRLRQQNPQKQFFPLSEGAVCQYMKMITLEKLHRTLRDLVYEVKVPEAIASRARIPIQRMLALA